MSFDRTGETPALDTQTVRLVHDMRNGLAAVRAAASILKRSGTDAQVIAKVAAGLHEQVRDMIAQLDDFVGRDTTTVTPASTDIGRPKPVVALHVLVADDNVDSANALAMFLRMEGHRVAVAFDGEQALQLATDERPDVMLLDLSMPGSDGCTLARMIRSQDWGADKRLIAISGWLSPEDRLRVRAAGFNAQLSKPLDMDLLQSLLQPAN